jgi:hypothetical protein
MSTVILFSVLTIRHFALSFSVFCSVMSLGTQRWHSPHSYNLYFCSVPLMEVGRRKKLFLAWAPVGASGRWWWHWCGGGVGEVMVTLVWWGHRGGDGGTGVVGTSAGVEVQLRQGSELVWAAQLWLSPVLQALGDKNDSCASPTKCVSVFLRFLVFIQPCFLFYSPFNINQENSALMFEIHRMVLLCVFGTSIIMQCCVQKRG